MASRFLDANVAARAHIATLYLFVVVLSIACAGLWYGWKTAPQSLRISIPPDLSAGAIVKPDEFHPAQVFGFAMIYHLALNRWRDDGAVDMRARIEELQDYLTPDYRRELIATMERKMSAGELEGRSRYTLAAEGFGEYKPHLVETVDHDRWVVHLEVEIVEHVSDLESKRVTVHYPLSVVRLNIDPTRNIWGLALDGTPPGQPEYRVVADSAGSES